MATNLEHTVSFPFGTERLWEVVTSEKYWRDLLTAINRDKGVLESFDVTGDTVTVVCKQVVDEGKLPSIVTKIRSGDLVIPRRTVLRRVGNEITGDLEATVEGAPAKVSGTQVSSGDPSTTRYTASVSVGIPLVGGKIEKAIGEQLIALLDAERDETLNWEAGNR
ncbi:hypothetical protein GOARA_082_00210 [Gordonia araii NBRC 100433]|uniref:DUF2505 domain-containing protein n=1 Tax=Gordonia araii NBRC 100433 TaxID=1073574 RepID=G7H709_9ACTN|nr:DUF2505 domain-containing protein [Gordonia araii]NNG97630.1 DUF2505 domain-containing protein [Gordonia araii NBRC 100433]GAB11634.1 hypothetical protein GOARA_082_00210 [Gordonia araii NBRC 100433]